MSRPKCRACGCTDEIGCDEGCEWVERDLCSACIPKLQRARDAVIFYRATRDFHRSLEQSVRAAAAQAAKLLRDLPSGVEIDGRVYKAHPSWDEVRVGLAPRKKGHRP